MYVIGVGTDLTADFVMLLTHSLLGVPDWISELVLSYESHTETSYTPHRTLWPLLPHLCRYCSSFPAYHWACICATEGILAEFKMIHSIEMM